MEILVNENVIKIKKGDDVYEIIGDFYDCEVENGYITDVDSILITINKNDNELVSLIVYEDRILITHSNINKVYLDVLVKNINIEFAIIPVMYIHLRKKLINLIPILVEIIENV